MAPSVRGAGTRMRQAQPTLLGYAKVTKAKKFEPTTKIRAKGVKITIENVEVVSNNISEGGPIVCLPSLTPSPTEVRNKRKRRARPEESDADEAPTVKKVKIFLPLPSPPDADRSRRSTPEPEPCFCHGRYDRSPSPPPMPQPLGALGDIYIHFIRAFTLHRAHNGPTAPADLQELMHSVTGLYKKRSIGKEDIQRMLAIFELEGKTELVPKSMLPHTHSPFKLITSGVGAGRRNFIEFVGHNPDLEYNNLDWNEYTLLEHYENDHERAYLSGRRNLESFIHSPIEDYPLLAFAVGAQTAARQHKNSELRKHVLNKESIRSTSPEMSNLSISSPDSPPQASKAVKSRTLSLFERVKAKQSAAAAMPAPTSQASLRKHAIGRIDEVVEILKMKQHQKLSHMLEPGYETPETPLRRVSFAMPELIRIVKASMNNPIGDAELKMCIDIMAREAPGFWLRRLSADGVLCVVLQGNGPVGCDVQRSLKAMESRKLDADIFDIETTD